jgi:ParB family chromosome partitioning protein
MMYIREIARETPISVDLKHIDENLGPHSMSFGFDLEPLMRSIKQYGLINAPFVMGASDGRMDVVVGYRRILALKSLQCETVPCVDLSDSGLSPLELLHFNLHDNLTTRKFNEVETGMILKRLTPHVSREEILAHYMPLLNLPSHASSLDFYMKLEDLDENIKKSIVEGALSLKATKLILDSDHEHHSVIFRWIIHIKFNFNQQIQFIEYVCDISIKENKPIHEILSEVQLVSISEDQKLNNPQKAKRILDLLRSRRYPSLTRAEKTFKATVSSLDLPKGVRVKHPPFFEAPDYVLEILFRDGKDLKDKINSLYRLRDLERIGDPMQERS